MKEQLLQALLPILVTTVTGATVWLGRSISLYIGRKSYELDCASLRDTARAVVADFQVAVDNAKDSRKPGKWSRELGASLRIEAIRRVKAMAPLAARNVLTTLAGDVESLDALIGAYIEAEVRRLRRGELP